MKRTGRVRLNLSDVGREFGFHRSTAIGGLKQLEEAGLAAVERGNGKCAWVTLLPVERAFEEGLTGPTQP
jgi:hypothetical protein